MSDDKLDAINHSLAALLERTTDTPTWGRWLDLETAERYCRLSIRTLRRLISSGDLTPHRAVAGKVLIDRLALDALILARAWSKPRRSRAGGARA